MKIKTFPIGPLQTNCYMLAGDNKALVIDPGGNPNEILSYAEKIGVEITHILNTHLHFDHTYGNHTLSEATGAPVLCSAKDLELLQTELGAGGAFGLPLVDQYETTSIEPGEYTFAEFQCHVYETPGHSPGSFTYYFPMVHTAFVGDLIFYRSIGRTDFPGGNIETLKESISTYIFTLPPETQLLSGHGQATTVGEEMHHNPYLSQFA